MSSKTRRFNEYLGDINYYLEQRKLDNMREIEKKEVVQKVQPKQEKNLSFEEQKQKKALQNKLSKVESNIQQLEKQIVQDDLKLAQNYEKLMNDSSFFTAYENKKKELEQLLEDWEAIQLELE